MMLYGTSHLFLLSFLYALYRGHYMISIGPGVVFITSINYWRKPDLSWRLHFDVYTVRIAIVYQTIMAYNAEYSRIYYLTYMLSPLYALGQYYFNKGDHCKYAYIHMTSHILANIVCCILYYGYMNPISTPSLSV